SWSKRRWGDSFNHAAWSTPRGEKRLQMSRLEGLVIRRRDGRLGLSRRRSRVRVPSLPSLEVPARFELPPARSRATLPMRGPTPAWPKHGRSPRHCRHSAAARVGAAADAYARAAAHASASGYRRLQHRVQASRVVQEAWGHFPAGEGARNCDRLLVEVEGTALEPYIRGARSLYRCWQGDFAGARSDILRACSLLRDFGNDLMAEASAMMEAQIELDAGDPVAAEAAARDAYDALGRLDEQGYRSTVGCLLAEGLCQLGRDAEAEQVAVEAAALPSAD